MTLVPLNGVAELVSKIAENDPETARLFAQMGLYEVLNDIIDVYREDIDEVVTKAMIATADDARRELVRVYVDRRMNNQDVEDVVKAAAALDIVDVHIAKADFDEKLHRRDPATGRWVVQLNVARTPDPRNQRDAHASAVANQLEEWRASGLVGANAKVVLSDDSDNRREHTVQSSHTADRNAALKHENFMPTKVELHPDQAKGVPAAGQKSRLAFDALAYATKSPTRASQLTPSNDQAFSDQYNDLLSGSGHPAFRTLRAGGAALQATSVPGSGQHAAGAVAQLAGHLGPEAQRVLGPGFARLSYKYRGTEKKPDEELVTEVNNATALTNLSPSGYAQAKKDGKVPEFFPGVNPGVGAADLHHSNPYLTPDQRKLLARGDTAVNYFIASHQIPNMKQAQLSIRAGRVPPSVGTIIDADGEVVSEAMGTGEDHYLPFDLKNLKELHGGQYVRTRLAGGPSTEDIYTGLLTGARQLQVVSNSGVFTLEFDPDLRGGRRYSDKARQMVGRYQQLLEAINNNKNPDLEDPLMENEIPPDKMRAMRADALDRSMGDTDYAETLFKEGKKRFLAEQRFNSEASDSELRFKAAETVDAEGTATSTQDRGNKIDTEHRRLTAEARDFQVRRLQLDGKGYERAMQSLKQEFPYFIRNVKWEGLRDFTDSVKQTDPRRPSYSNSPRAVDTGHLSPGDLSTSRRADSLRRPSGQQAPRAEQVSVPESGTTASPVPSAAPEAPRAPVGPGGKPVVPGDKPIQVPAYAQMPATTLEALGAGPVVAETRASLNKIASVLPNVRTGSNPEATEIANPEIVGDAPTYVRAVMAHFGVGNESGVIDYFADPSPVALEDSPRAKKGEPQERDLNKFIEGLGIINGEIQSDYDQKINTAERDKAPAEMFDQAAVQLQRIAALRKPFADPAAKPMEYNPGSNGAPQRYADVVGLGDNPDRYKAFYDGAARSDPALAAAIDHARALPDAAARRNAVRDRVEEHQNAMKAADLTIGTPVHGKLPAGYEQSVVGARQYRQDRPEEKLRVAQKAWAFVHAEDLMNSLPGGGAGGPKGQGFQGFKPIPQFRVGNTVQAKGGPVDPLNKRLDKPRQLIVHPPGSAIAKALARVRQSTP